ncbi:MAG: rhodanese-like domain-containing protein [Acidobacteriota bacterium]|nr:rhodanese-like domain-containing protein [Blastocatellia bacterium]MDW8412198.1 rhodanese-like domain-containing protein [Acidobacteriota bacterium]
MIKTILLSLLVCSVVAAQSVATQNPADEIEKVTVEQLKAMMDKKEKVLVVDVRNNPANIIKGAQVIPLHELEQKADQLPKNSFIVTVCACPSEGTSGQAVRILKAKGFTKVAALKGGQRAWESANYPTEEYKH